MAGEQPRDSDTQKVAAVIYEHLRQTRDRDDEAHPSYLSKTRFFMSIVLVVFGAMSFALSRAEWAVEDESTIHLVLLLIIGGISSVVLFTALWCGIECHRVKQTAVVGVTALKDVLESDSWKLLSPEKTYHDLSVNLADTILTNRKADTKRAHWARWLHAATLAGSLLAAVFIVYALLGDVLNAKPETTMSEPNEKPSEQERPSEPDLTERSDSINESDSGPRPHSEEER